MSTVTIMPVGKTVEAAEGMTLLAAILAAIWFWHQRVLFAVALLYMFSGVLWRLQWIIRRRPSPPAPPAPAYKEASQPS